MTDPLAKLDKALSSGCAEAHLVLPAREGRSGALIRASNDAEAVAQWLAEYRDTPQTWRAYRREARRLLLWLDKQGAGLGDVDRETLRRFEAFLADPPASWTGPARPEGHPGWRPFRGALSPASRRQALVILQGLYGWLVEAGWVTHNPFRLMRDKSRRLNNQAGRIERYLERNLWDWFWRWLNRPPAADATPRQRYEQARRCVVFGFAYLLAPRIAEMAAAGMNDFFLLEGRIWWRVTGKGGKLAEVPVPDDFLACLKQWRGALGLSALPTHDEDTPLIRALDGRRAVGDNQLYRLIRRTFDRAAEALKGEGGSAAAVNTLRRATPHWLRHTSITHQAQAGIDLHYLAESARHSRLDTTSRYLHTEEARWHAEQQRHRLTPPTDEDAPRVSPGR
ncbi:site-specific integrase [Halomonas piscis]|uniref:Site-specific integrase n=1 Tax=Halomonas piscis TaxID=3031727 RepID=A0ABY9YVJ0_9GAMM|nr:site-specific integrase [Halomonas piscis]WNK18885.1 site-specific integrase [Halomonas piscis]